METFGRPKGRPFFASIDAAQFSLVVTVLGDRFLPVAFIIVLDYIFFVTFMEVFMFTVPEKAHLLVAIDLLAAQKARFAKSQPEFLPIAEALNREYDAIRLKLRSAGDEAPSGVKK